MGQVPPYAEGVRETARRQRREGVKVAEIAFLLNVSGQTVRRWTRDIELPVRDCLLCERPARNHPIQQSLFCSKAHYRKYCEVFGWPQNRRMI